MTNIDLIRDALGLIGVLNEVESPSAEQGVHGLRVLNQMMEMLEEDGVRLQYFAQTLTTDSFPCPAWTEMGVTANLAVKLAPSYGAAISAELADQADKGMQTLLRKTIRAPVADMSHLPQGEGRYARDDILNG